MSDLLSRKFISTVLVLVLSFVLVLIGKLDATTWLNMATIAVGIYNGLNVAQKALVK